MQKPPENVSKIFCAGRVFCGEGLQAFIKMSKCLLPRKVKNHSSHSQQSLLESHVGKLGRAYLKASILKDQFHKLFILDHAMKTLRVFRPCH